MYHPDAGDGVLEGVVDEHGGGDQGQALHDEVRAETAVDPAPGADLEQAAQRVVGAAGDDRAVPGDRVRDDVVQEVAMGDDQTVAGVGLFLGDKSFHPGVVIGSASVSRRSL